MTVDPTAVKAAQEKLDAHLREIVQWHFSPETGCPFWLGWAKKNFDPRQEINTFTDMLKFPHFADECLRDLQPEQRKDGLLPELTGVKSYQPAEFKEKVDWMMERGFLAEAPDYKDVVRSK